MQAHFRLGGDVPKGRPTGAPRLALAPATVGTRSSLAPRAPGVSWVPLPLLPRRQEMRLRHSHVHLFPEPAHVGAAPGAGAAGGQ